MIHANSATGITKQYNGDVSCRRLSLRPGMVFYNDHLRAEIIPPLAPGEGSQIRGHNPTAQHQEPASKPSGM